MSNTLQRRQFSLLAFVFQLIFTVAFALFARFDNESDDRLERDYPMFQDVHVMVIVGFGFLISFLKRYGFSAISVNLLLAGFVIQYAMLLRGFLSQSFVTKGYFTITIDELITADLSAVTVLISMGVLLGKLTPVQFLVLAFMETSLSVLLEHILFSILVVNDCGRSLIVHCFGAYFGLAAAKVCHKWHSTLEHEAEEVDLIHHSELFSMIGTLFLWILFPSFNAVGVGVEDGRGRSRAIMNTYLAISACTTTTFTVSSLSDHLGRFNMLHIQSSTLAGGIAVGSVANVILKPHEALMVGAVGGLVSVIGHVYLTPQVLEKRLALFDTCGVHNLHGLPGLISGLFAVLFLLLKDPSVNNTNNIHLHQMNGTLLLLEEERGGDRDKYTQAAFQLLAIILTLLMAIGGGLMTGRVMNLSLLNQVQDQPPSYEDSNYFLHAEFSLFGKLDSVLVVDEFNADDGKRADESNNSKIRRESGSLRYHQYARNVY